MSGTGADIALACIEDGLVTALSPATLLELLQQQTSAIVQCAQRCVLASGTQALDAVYLTGGSSGLTPLVEALELAFPGADMVQGDRFGGVAAGLAWAGFAANRS